MHEHEWKVISQIVEGDSVDTYYSCECRNVRHVYTYDPGKIRYESIHSAMSWVDGYAHGIARGMKKIGGLE